MMYSNNYGMPTYETRVYEGVPYTTMSLGGTAGAGGVRRRHQDRQSDPGSG